MERKNSITLSIVIPVFCEEDNIQYIFDQMIDHVGSMNIPYEIIFIDDGSTDQTWNKITALGRQHPEVKGLRFSRNFGKENALFAGLTYAAGDAVITIDGDMQHPPELIPKMYQLWENNSAEIVDVIKKTRPKETLFYKINSSIFYFLFQKLSGLEITNATDFKLLDRKVVDNIVQMQETNRFYRGITHWVGFKHETIQISIPDRLQGGTKWKISGLFTYAMNNILGFTSKPLLFIGIMGIVFLISAIIVLLISVVRILTNTTAEGFPTVIFLILFTGGIIISSQFLMGIYIAKVFDEVKHRPSYIIKQLLNI